MMIIDNNQNADDTLHFSVRLIIWTFSESSSVSRNILGKSIGQKEVKMRPCKRLLNTASTLGNHIQRVKR